MVLVLMATRWARQETPSLRCCCCEFREGTRGSVRARCGKNAATPHMHNESARTRNQPEWVRSKEERKRTATETPFNAQESNADEESQEFQVKARKKKKKRAQNRI